MSVTVTGDKEMLAYLARLDKSVDAKSRKAVRDGAGIFKDRLVDNTPVYPGKDHSGKTPLAKHVVTGNLRTATGEVEQNVGYDKEKGYIAHFPNSGTSKQDPQNFIEDTQIEVTDTIIAKFIEDLQL